MKIKQTNPLERLRHHVTGAIERGEATPIIEQTDTPAQAQPHPSEAVQLIQKVIYYCQKQCDTSPDEALLWAQCKSMAQAAQETTKKEVISVLKCGVTLGEASAEFKTISKKRWTQAYQHQIDELIKESEGYRNNAGRLADAARLAVAKMEAAGIGFGETELREALAGWEAGQK